MIRRPTWQRTEIAARIRLPLVDDLLSGLGNLDRFNRQRAYAHALMIDTLPPTIVQELQRLHANALDQAARLAGVEDRLNQLWCRIAPDAHRRRNPRRRVPGSRHGPQRYADHLEFIRASNLAQQQLARQYTRITVQNLADELGIGERTWRRTRDHHGLRGLPPWCSADTE